MRYFFVRLAAFLLVSIVVHFGPNFAASRSSLSASIEQFVSYSVVLSVAFTIVFSTSGLLWGALLRWPGIRVNPEVLFGACFLAGSAAFLFAPRPSGFSFGDGVALIVRDGYLTPYGWKVQAEVFFRCELVAVLFWRAFRLRRVNENAA